MVPQDTFFNPRIHKYFSRRPRTGGKRPASLWIYSCRFFGFTATAEKDLENAQLVQILHRLLSDERSAPEIKYNSMVLICALMGSGESFPCSAFPASKTMGRGRYCLVTFG